MKDRSNQLGNFDPDYPGGRVIVSDAAGLALVPDFVRQSVPNTPFVTADEAGLPKTLRRTDKNNISPRLGIAWRPTDDGRTVVRGGFGLYTVPLLGSVNYSMVATVTAAAVSFANSPANPFVFPNISSAGVGRGRAAAGHARLPPRQPDRHARSADDAVERDRRARSRLEHRRARQLRRIDDTKDLIWSPDLNQVPSNTLGYDAVKDTRPFTDWNVVTTRANDPRSRYDALGLELNKRVSDGLTLRTARTRWRGTSPTPAAPCRRRSRPRTARRRSICSAATPTTATSRSRAGTASSARSSTSCRSAAAVASPATSAAASMLLVGGWDVTGVTLFQSGPFLTPSFSNGDPVGHRRDRARLHRDAAAGSGRRRQPRQPDCRRVLRSRRVRPCRPTTSAASATPASASSSVPARGSSR